MAGSVYFTFRPGSRWCSASSSSRWDRLPECTVSFDDPNISREHARIQPDGNGFVLTDNGSTNGTLVNGTAVTSHRLPTATASTRGHEPRVSGGLTCAAPGTIGRRLGVSLGRPCRTSCSSFSGVSSRPRLPGVSPRPSSGVGRTSSRGGRAGAHRRPPRAGTAGRASGTGLRLPRRSRPPRW